MVWYPNYKYYSLRLNEEEDGEGEKKEETVVNKPKFATMTWQGLSEILYLLLTDKKINNKQPKLDFKCPDLKSLAVKSWLKPTSLNFIYIISQIIKNIEAVNIVVVNREAVNDLTTAKFECGWLDLTYRLLEQLNDELDESELDKLNSITIAEKIKIVFKNFVFMSYTHYMSKNKEQEESITNDKYRLKEYLKKIYKNL